MDVLRNLLQPEREKYYTGLWVAYLFAWDFAAIEGTIRLKDLGQASWQLEG